MRTFLTGLMIVILELSGFSLYSSLFPGSPPWLTGIVMALLLLCLIILSVAVHRSQIPTGEQDRYGQLDQVASLEKAGLLVDEEYRATRAFAVREFEDEGPHCYLALDNGRTLHLNGQYLDEYMPLSHGEREGGIRTFPCDKFTVRKHKTDGYVIDLRCDGSLLPLDAIAHPFTSQDLDASFTHEDGQIIEDRTYEDLLAERRRAEQQPKKRRGR